MFLFNETQMKPIKTQNVLLYDEVIMFLMHFNVLYSIEEMCNVFVNSVNLG